MLSLIATAILLMPAQDAAARALHAEVAKELGKHKTIQGTVVVNMNGQKDTCDFKLMKPNLFKFVGKNQSAWSDGEFNYTMMDGLAAPHCNKASETAIEAPFLRGLEGFTNNKDAKIKLVSLKEGKFEGKTCRVLSYEQAAYESDAGSLPKLTVMVYIDASKPMPLGWNTKGDGFEIAATYKNFVFDKELKKSDFKGDQPELLKKS